MNKSSWHRVMTVLLVVMVLVMCTALVLQLAGCESGTSDDNHEPTPTSAGPTPTSWGPTPTPTQAAP